MTILDVVASIIINLFSSQLYDGKVSVCEKIRLKRFRKKLLKWVRKYIINHDGTVLTTSDFELFLKNYHLIENIFKQISSGKTGVSKEVFINKQIELFHRVQNHPNTNLFDTNLILKEFIMHIYEEIDSFFMKNLSQNEKYILSKSNEGNKAVIDVVQTTEDVLHEDINDIKRLLQEKKEINNPEVVRSIYQNISALLLKGKINEVLQLYPLIEGKSKELESSITYLLCLFSDNESFNVDFSKIQNEIKDEQIYNHICRISIYINKWRNNNLNLSKVSYRNQDLKQIVQFLLEDKYEHFYSIEKSEQNGITYYTYKVENFFPNEKWLVKRICLLNIFEQRLLNTSESVKQLIGYPDNILDELIFVESRVFELYGKLEISIENVKELYSDSLELVNKTGNLANDIKIRIYEMLLRTSLMFSKEKAYEVSEMIPQSLQEEKNIELLLMQIKLTRGAVDFDEVINVCMKHGEYWLLNNYLIAHVYDAPLEMKILIEKYKYVIDLDPSIFLIYAQLVNNLGQRDEAIDLFEKYRKKYGNYIEFWINKLRIKYIKEEMEFMITEYKNGNLNNLINGSTLALVELLVKYNQYDEALEIIKKNEIIENVTNDLLRLKAISLCNTKHELESLSIFLKLFDEGNRNEETIYYILVLSCNNKRTVSSEVVRYAKQSDNPQILMLVASVIVLENNVDDAFRMNLKAMLRTTDNKSDVFNQYLGIEMLEDHSEKNVINCVDVDTVVSLRNSEKEIKIVYVIHSSQLLTEEPFIWENAIHIYKETAIMLGLFRKKVGDNVIIESQSYSVEDILPIKTYFFRLSMEKIIAKKEAKMISIPITDDSKLDLEKFTKIVKETIGDDKNHFEWLNQYKDFNQIPVTFNFYKRFVRITYFQLISAVLIDNTILYRENNDTFSHKFEEYVFSYAALVVLFRLGWNGLSNKSKYSIPTAMKKVIYDEVEEIIRHNNREHVSFMGINDKQLYFVENSEEEKKQCMQEAVEFKAYCEQYITLDNNTDLHLEDDYNVNIKDVLGISDYDAIIIAKRTGRALVSAEVLVSGICQMPETDVLSIGIADFLAKEANDCEELLMYVRKMIEYRCTIPFTVQTIKRILEFFKQSDEKEKRSINEKFLEILQLPIEDETYRSIMLYRIQDCLNRLNPEEGKITAIEKNLLNYWLIYSGQKVIVTINENGELITQIVKTDAEIQKS